MPLKRRKLSKLKLRKWHSNLKERAHRHRMIKKTSSATTKTKCFFTVCSGPTIKLTSTIQILLPVTLRLNKRNRLAKKLSNTYSQNLRKNSSRTNLTIFLKRTRCQSRPYCAKWQMAIGTLSKILTMNTISVSRPVMSFIAERSWFWCTLTS